MSEAPGTRHAVVSIEPQEEHDVSDDEPEVVTPADAAVLDVTAEVWFESPLLIVERA
jgi:hypothetical protein